MDYPDESECKELLSNFEIPKAVMKHSLEVKKNALKISQKLIKNGFDINLGLIKSAAILHDIGRWKYSKQKGCSEEEGIFHIYETYRILYQSSYDKFARLCASHALGGLNKVECRILFSKDIDLMTWTIESKIINIADKINKERKTLSEILDYYLNEKKYHQRFFNKMPVLRKRTEKRISEMWNELQMT